MDTNPQLTGILTVLLLSAILVVLVWPRMAKWLKKGLLCIMIGLFLVGLGLLAPRKHFDEDSRYLVTAEGSQTALNGIESGRELNRKERFGAYTALVLGGLLLLGGSVVLVRRR
jgi:hypothetical protein